MTIENVGGLDPPAFPITMRIMQVCIEVGMANMDELALANAIEELVWNCIDRGELGAQAALKAVRYALENVAESYREGGHHTGYLAFDMAAESLKDNED